MLKVAILGSGRGSNASAILEAQTRGGLGNVRIVGILSDNENARILTLGKEYGIAAKFIPPGKFKTKLTPDVEAQYVSVLQEWKTELVVLAGFMRVIKSPLLSAYSDRIINLHPSLLPEFPGLNSIQRALEAGISETGCTVHWVNEDIDAGHIIKQAHVKIHKGDTLDQLEDRMHAAEHQLLPTVIRELAENWTQGSGFRIQDG